MFHGYRATRPVKIPANGDLAIATRIQASVIPYSMEGSLCPKMLHFELGKCRYDSNASCIKLTEPWAAFTAKKRCFLKIPLKKRTLRTNYTRFTRNDQSPSCGSIQVMG